MISSSLIILLILAPTQSLRAEQDCNELANECAVVIDLAARAIEQKDAVISEQGELITDLRFQRDFYKGISEEPPSFWDSTTFKVILFGAGVFGGFKLAK